MKIQLPKHLKKIRESVYTADDLIDFENEVKDHYENGEIKATIHLSKGNENQLIEIFKYISEDDWGFSSWRNHYHALLHGVNKQSLLKDIISDDSHREIFFSENSRDFISINTTYDKKSQSFKVNFTFAPSKLKVSFPMTLRTRTSGGWGGKNLYMTTSGFKIT